MLNALTVDVEEGFHASEVQRWVGRESWESMHSRVVEATRRVLDILGRNGVRATFFVVGWVAEKHPRLVREILEAGHEVGCHSYAHHLVYELTPQEFQADTEKACLRIEDACGRRPKIYRAPSYSITQDSLWALEILAGLGFICDSSIYPVRHDRYGIPGFGRHAQWIETSQGALLEVPPASVRLGTGQVAPVGGGGYFRLLPYRYTAAGIRKINVEEQQPACIYIHPWELDAAQPRLARGWLSQWRCYGGLQRMADKLERLLREFRFGPMSEVYRLP